MRLFKRGRAHVRGVTKRQWLRSTAAVRDVGLDEHHSGRLADKQSSSSTLMAMTSGLLAHHLTASRSAHSAKSAYARPNNLNACASVRSGWHQACDRKKS